MKSNRMLAWVIGGIMIVAFTATICLLWPTKNLMFWITYLFILSGIIGVTINVALLNAASHHFASNLVTLTVSVLYLLATVANSAIGILFFETATYLVAHILLLAVFLCIWLISRSAAAYINKQD